MTKIEVFGQGQSSSLRHTASDQRPHYELKKWYEEYLQQFRVGRRKRVRPTFRPQSYSYDLE